MRQNTNTTSKTIWAFDLGLASIGEAVRNTQTQEIIHAASLILPAECASIADARDRRRAMRTREAHKARESWLDQIWHESGMTPLQKRKPFYDEIQEKWIPEKCQKADYRLEREFPPAQQKRDKDGKLVDIVYPNGKAKDGAPASKQEDFEICYNSALLRIKLLRGEKLEEWQIYKALHAALQKRGYGQVAWANKEALREPKKKADEEKEDQALADKWKTFEQEVREHLPESCAEADQFLTPCYYDAFNMGLWNPDKPDNLTNKTDCHAKSTQQIRFPREKVELEIINLANQATKQLENLSSFFGMVQKEGLVLTDLVSGKTVGGTKYEGERKRKVKVLAKDFGHLLCHGPAGRAFATYTERKEGEEALSFETIAHPDPKQIGKQKFGTAGTPLDWCAATGQKIPRFDNRILAPCALMPRLNVCRIAPKFKREQNANEPKQVEPKTLLAAEVVFLLQAKNLRLDDIGAHAVRFLNRDELNQLIEEARTRVEEFLKQGKPEHHILEAYKLTSHQWKKWCASKGCRALLDGKGAGNDDTAEDETQPAQDSKSKSTDTIKAPHASGRSRFSRPALAILRHLLLESFQDCLPSSILDQIEQGEKTVLDALGMDVLDAIPLKDGKKGQFEKRDKPWILKAEIESLRGVWKPAKLDNGMDRPYSPSQIHIPDLKLRYIKQKYNLTDRPFSEISKANDPEVAKRSSAIYELIREQNNPIVRDRLERFWKRLGAFGTEKNLSDPECLVLEFVREDDNSLDSQKQKKAYSDSIQKNEDRRDKARKALQDQGVANPTDSQILRFMLWKDQGGQCPYTAAGLGCTRVPDWDMDHIIPRSMGGPDAYWNWVLAHPDANAEKGNLTPYQWFHEEKTSDEWTAYKNRILTLRKELGYRKADILLREDAASLIGEKYTALAVTSWISRLAQSIARLHFGWPLDDDEGKERVLTISGGLTGRIRRKYLLDSLLGPALPQAAHTEEKPDPATVRQGIDETLDALSKLKRQDGESDAEARLRQETRAELRQKLIDLARLSEKLRSDKRHHALDAILLTFLPNWARDKKKEDFFRLTEIGDNPIYSDAGRQNKIQCEDEIARLYRENQDVFQKIKESRNREDKAEIKKLKDSVLKVRKRMALLFETVEKRKQHRNIKAVRDWFRLQLWKDDNTTPNILPHHIASRKAAIEKTSYGMSYIVQTANQQSAVPLFKLGDRPDFHDETVLVYDRRYLLTQIHAISAIHKDKTEESHKRLKAYLRDEFTKNGIPDTSKAWQHICQREEVRAFFPPKSKKSHQSTLEDCLVRLRKIEILMASRPLGTGSLVDIAYGSGSSLVYDLEHLQQNIPKICVRMEKNKPASCDTADICPNWTNFRFDKKLQVKFQTEEFQKKLKELADYLPGPKPKDGAAEWEVKDKEWTEHRKKFVSTHGIPPNLFLYDESSSKPKPKARSAWDAVLLRKVERQFSLTTLKKQADKVMHPDLSNDLKSFASALVSAPSDKERDCLWCEFCKVWKAVKREVKNQFIVTNPEPTAEQWNEFFAKQSGSMIRKINLLTGADTSEYADLSKDGSGQWFKGNNQGYWLVKRKKGNTEEYEYRAQAIRFFEASTDVKKRLGNQGWTPIDELPWHWGMLLYLDEKAGTQKKFVLPGYYFLGSFSNKGATVNLNSCFGEDVPSAISLSSLMQAKLKRA